MRASIASTGLSSRLDGRRQGCRFRGYPLATSSKWSCGGHREDRGDARGAGRSWRTILRTGDGDCWVGKQCPAAYYIPLYKRVRVPKGSYTSYPRQYFWQWTMTILGHSSLAVFPRAGAWATLRDVGGSMHAQHNAGYARNPRLRTNSTTDLSISSVRMEPG